jgi:phage tail-like protein
VKVTYNFRIKWEGRYVAAVSSVSGLSRKTQSVSSEAGGPPRLANKIPGQSDYAPIRLARGIVTDTAFDDWAKLLWNYPEAGEVGDEASLQSFRKEMQVELNDQTGQPMLRYNLHGCWPSEYTPLPELDSESNAVALASMTLEHEGWGRDPTLTPP